MKYNNLIMYFTSQDKLEELIKELIPTFDMIDDYGKQILGNIMSISDEFIEARSRLRGALIELNPILSAAMTAKRNGMLHYYVKEKREIENKTPEKDEKGKLVKEKFAAGATETEAEESVAEFRRVRNILQGYINACLTGIKDCEDRLMDLKVEYKNG